MDHSATLTGQTSKRQIVVMFALTSASEPLGWLRPSVNILLSDSKTLYTHSWRFLLLAFFPILSITT